MPSSSVAPGFLLSYPHCGHRLVTTAVAPGTESDELSPMACSAAVLRPLLSKDTRSLLNLTSRYWEQKIDATVI
jgi:hypothetical protein